MRLTPRDRTLLLQGKCRMANSVLSYADIKYVTKMVLDDYQARLVFPTRPFGKQDEVFYIYNGHDPYNSADSPSFMDRVARQQEPTND